MSSRGDTFVGRSVLVTGGAGFIGSHLVEELVQREARVTVWDNLSNGRLSHLAAIINQIEMREVDLASDDLPAALTGRSFVFAFHLAGSADIPSSVSDPAADFQRNLLPAFRLLNAFRDFSPGTRIIFASSAAVYGEGAETPLREDDATRPVSPYGVGKLAVEHYLSVFSRLYDLRTASLRLFPVFGPRLRKQVIYDLMSKLQQNPWELALRGDGTEARDFSFVANAVEAFLTVAENAPLKGEIYNAGSGELISIAELGELLCQRLGVRPRFVYDGDRGTGVSRQWSADFSRLRGLGYQPQIALAEGLARTVNWFRQDQSRCGGA